MAEKLSSGQSTSLALACGAGTCLTRTQRENGPPVYPHFRDYHSNDNSLFWGISQRVNIPAGVNPRDRDYQHSYKIFRRRLVEARKEAGLTQRKVCEKMGKSSSFISKCELGERRVDFVELRKLARIYRKAVSFFNPRSR